jgi:hypothetical protein
MLRYEGDVEDIDFNDTTTISIEGAGEDFQGVEVDTSRNPIRRGNHIFIPVCIYKKATTGEWTIIIETEKVVSHDSS